MRPAATAPSAAPGLRAGRHLPRPRGLRRRGRTLLQRPRLRARHRVPTGPLRRARRLRLRESTLLPGQLVQRGQRVPERPLRRRHEHLRRSWACVLHGRFVRGRPQLLQRHLRALHGLGQRVPRRHRLLRRLRLPPHARRPAMLPQRGPELRQQPRLLRLHALRRDRAALHLPGRGLGVYVRRRVLQRGHLRRRPVPRRGHLPGRGHDGLHDGVGVLHGPALRGLAHAALLHARGLAVRRRGGRCGRGGGSCCGAMTCATSGTAPGRYCVCRGLDETCTGSDCCPGLTCNAGRCRPPTTTCLRPGDMTACTSDSQCCLGLRCNVLFGGRRCCTGAGSACRTSGDCCGSMLCNAGRCQCRTAGQACSNDNDCCGASARCEGGTCR